MELARMRRPAAGRVLAVVTVLPALAVAGWLLAGLGLLLAGAYRPLPAFLVGLPAAALLCWAGTRRPVPVHATAGQAASVLAVALASGVFNAVLHSEQLLVRRDPATYAQYAVWLARHGSLPIDVRAEAFGGPDRALVFDSVGFYPGDGAVVPQFMPGPPMLFALGEWLGGLLLTPAVLGALAVLTVGGLAARLVDGRWAPLAALAFAVSMPVLYTSRTTFSEIPSVILLFGGLALVHDALARRRRALPAALAGLVFGLCLLVRIDGLRDVLPALAFAGLLIALRRLAGRSSSSGAAGAARPVLAAGGGLPLLGGLVAGAGAGLLAAYVVARPYLNYLSRSVEPLLLICGGVLVLIAAGTAAAPVLARVRVPRRVPSAGAALVVLVMAGLAVRPWIQTVRRDPDNVDDQRTYIFIEQIQKANGLPADGSRLYFENSLHWVAWYIGIPAVVLATLAGAVLLRRLLRGRDLGWLLPLAVIGWTTVTTLLRPEITPDHPWAARRLVPVVIPGLILLAVWGARWLTGRFPRRWVAPLTALLVLAPPVVTSIGTAFTPVERGEAAAVARMCARIPDDASVLIVERVTGDRFTQLVRGMCGVPAAKVVPGASADEVRRLIARVRAAGRTPVVLAAEAGQVAPYGTPAQVMGLVTRQDERSLTSRPDGTWSLRVNVWMAIP